MRDVPELAAVRKACLGRPVAELNTGWEDVLVPLGLTLAGRMFGDAEMLTWAREWADYHLAERIRNSPPDSRSGRQHSGARHRGVFLTPFCGEWGALSVFAELSRSNGTDSEGAADFGGVIRTIADHVCDGGVHGEDGVLYHGPQAPMPWVDTLYYSSAPLARAFAVTGAERYAEEAVRQCLLHAKHLRDERTGCFVHEADPVSGKRTGWLWSRGNGWVVMAFADTLRLCPASTAGWEELLRLYRSLVVGLLRYQHPCGLWRIVPENAESHLETSGSVMIATGLAVGIAEEWIEAGHAHDVLRTWRETVTWVTDDGRLMGCQTPAGRGGWETHKRSAMGERTYGTGSLLRLAAELCNAKVL